MNVPDQMAGWKAKCPKCANVFVLPGGDEGVSALPVAAVPAAATPPRRSRDEDFDDRPARRGPNRDRDYDDNADRPRSGGTNGLAIAGMVLGIVGALVAWVPCFGWILGIILGIIGAALSGIGLAQAGKIGSGKGMAIAGLILSIIAIILGPVSYFMFVAAAVNVANQAQKNIFNELKNLKDVGKINFNANHPPVAANAKSINIDNINPNERKTFEIAFEKNKMAEIWVKSDMETDVDLFVFDKNNAQVALDLMVGKDCYVTFMASQDEPYRVEVSNNFGGGPNKGKLLHTGK